MVALTTNMGGTVKPRQRRFNPKVRTGCQTCKIRRVKCGEERPSCQRCVSGGRTCDGYETIRIAQTSTAANGTLTLKWVQPTSHPQDGNPQERHAFQYFRACVVEHLPGPFDPSVWYRQVLPISMTEPAVRHAVIALGSLSCQKCDLDGFEDEAFALKHYSKAMKALHNKIGGTDGEVARNVILITCLLFVAFEFQQSGWEQAKLHLDSGLHIIREMQNEPQSSTTPTPKMDQLVEAFERLDIQISLFTSDRVQLNRTHDEDATKSCETPVDTSFKGIADASRPLNLHMAAMRELVHKIEVRRFSSDGLTMYEYGMFETQVTQQLVSQKHWERALDELIPRLYGREMLWDSHVPDFAQLLDLAEEAMEMETWPASDDEGSKKRGFSLDMGVIPSTYFAAIKCRDPKLRRRALAILEGCRHQEGAWSGPFVASLAGAVIGMEEEGLEDPQSAADVPEYSRLYQAWYDLRLSESIVFCKRRCFELDGSWIEYQRDVC